MYLHIQRIVVFLSIAGLASCDGSAIRTQHPEPQPPNSSGGGQINPPYAAGIWISDIDLWFGDWRILLINDRNEFRLIELPYNIHGYGTVSYESPNRLNLGYFGIPPAAPQLHRWSYSVNCNMDGEIIEDDSAPLHVENQHVCDFSGDAADYRGAVRIEWSNPMIRLASSDEPFDPGKFEGTWTSIDDIGSDVVNIDAEGLITGQHGTSECIYAGRIFDRMPEGYIPLGGGVYDAEWTYESCAGESAYLNGVLFEGMAFFDDRTEILAIAATGMINDLAATVYLDWVAY